MVFLALRPYMQGDVIHGQVPAIKLESITGKAIDLSQVTEPTLVHLWATWCPICDLTKGSVESVAKKYRVINIATQSGDDEALLNYAQQNDMNPDIIINDYNGQLMNLFGAKAVPADFIISPGGNITFIEVGFTSELGLRLRLWWAGFSSNASQ